MKRLAWMLLLVSIPLSTGCTRPETLEGQTNSPAPVVLYVDNQRVGEFPDSETQAILRAAGLMDVEVVQSEGEVRAYRRPAMPSEPHIAGRTPDFDAKLRSAMQLLREKSPERYAALTKNVELILPGEGNTAYPENNTVTIARVDVEKGTITWLASTLAHEAEHLRVYHEDRTLSSNNAEDERNAYRVGIEVLKAVGADPVEIEWAEKKLAEYN